MLLIQNDENDLQRDEKKREELINIWVCAAAQWTIRAWPRQTLQWTLESAQERKNTNSKKEKGKSSENNYEKKWKWFYIYKIRAGHSKSQERNNTTFKKRKGHDPDKQVGGQCHLEANER